MGAEQTDSGGERRPVASVRSAATLREQLPGLEPERRVSDWGRSELIDGALDRSLYEFLYHYWFRVEVEGAGNLPAQGGALLVANRAGALPADAAMIAKAVRDRAGRAVHFATDRRLGATPGLDMLIVKAGAVAAHPANLQRLLYDEDQLVLAFPESGPPHGLRGRYRLSRFDRLGPIAAAAHARAPIVPVAVLGSEEAAPVLGRVRRLALSTGVPLPAKIRLRFLTPVAAVTPGEDLSALASDVRALIQENLLELLAARRSVWLG